MTTFEQTLHSLEPQLRSMALRRTRDQALTDEAMQAMRVKAIEGREGLEGRSSLQTWLYSILNNCIVDVIRDRKRHHGIPLEDVRAACEFEDIVVTQIAFHTEVNRLRPTYRNAVLAKLNGCPDSEMGKACGKNTAGAKSDYVRGAAVLRERLG